MRLTRRRFLTIACAASLAQPATAETQWRGRALGAEATISLTGSGADQAVLAARDTIRRLERQFSLHDPASALSRLNGMGHLRMSPEFSALMGKVDEMHKLTGGLFDPTVQPLWAAHAEGTDPDYARDLVGWQHVSIDGREIAFGRPGMAMTLNGIAQGFVTDRVRDVLSAHGYDDVLVNIGEYAIGDRDRRMGVAGLDGQIIAELKLRNEAVATSSPSALRFLDGASHILDPGGAPPSVWETVSVAASTATEADSISTALALMPDLVMADRLQATGRVRQIVLKHRSGLVYRM